jgi:hypothetical protein
MVGVPTLKPVGAVQVVSPIIGELAQKSTTIPCIAPVVAVVKPTSYDTLVPVMESLLIFT